MNIEKAWYRVSVKALIYNENGEILLCKENNGKWDLPGGGLDHGENPQKCIMRELQEEMCFIVTHINDTPKYFLTAHKPESKTRSWIANICYEVQVKNLDFTPSDECKEIGFFSANSIQKIDVLVNVLELSKQMNVYPNQNCSPLYNGEVANI